MNYIIIIGTVGASLTTVSLFPQVMKIWKTKRVGDLSLLTYLTLTTGAFLWVVYGILLKQPPIYIANILTFSLSLSILLLKIKHN